MASQEPARSCVSQEPGRSCPPLERVQAHFDGKWYQRRLLYERQSIGVFEMNDQRYVDHLTVSGVQEIVRQATVRGLVLFTAPRVVWTMIHYPTPMGLFEPAEAGKPERRGRRERFDPLYGIPQHAPERTGIEIEVSAWALPAMVWEPTDEPRGAVIPPMR